MKKQAGQEQGSAVKMKPVCEEAGGDDGWACVPLMRELFPVSIAGMAGLGSTGLKISLLFMT